MKIKGKLITLIESYTYLAKVFIILASFLFSHFLFILILIFQIFFPNSYEKLLNLIKDLKDEDEKMDEKISFNEDEDEEEDDFSLDMEEEDIIEEDDEFEDDDREMNLYSFIKRSFIAIYFGFGFSMMGILLSIIQEKLVIYAILIGFFLYCILYKYLFKFFYGFE